MKILLISHSDSGFGATIAVERLITALRARNVDADLGVIEKRTTNPAVILLKKKSYFDRFKLYRIIKKIGSKTGDFISNVQKARFKTSNTHIHSTNKKTLVDVNYINNSGYDLVHLHWVNYDVLSIKDIARIKKPLVWTLHDSWPFCGAEHHPNILENDTRFIEGYYRSNKPASTSGPDICRKTWERKRKAWRNTKFYFISNGSYEKDAFDKSALFRGSQSVCTVIHNIVPETVFKPADKKTLRELYQIPADKKVIGFGAAYDITDKKSIKGGYLLLDALQKLPDKNQYHLVIFGNDNPSFTGKLALPAFTAGFITNPYILASIYNLCDVFVCPSLLESSPTVCIEALFCGVPVAAFNTGGIPDIVEHQKTGYLAKCFDTDDLCEGIQFCANNYEELSRNSLVKAHRDFDNATLARKHVEWYNGVISS